MIRIIGAPDTKELEIKIDAVLAAHPGFHFIKSAQFQMIAIGNKPYYAVLLDMRNSNVD